MPQPAEHIFYTDARTCCKSNKRSETPANLEHEVHRSLRIETGLGIVEVVLLEIGAPEPCVGVVLVVEDVVDVETEIQRTVISSEAERPAKRYRISHSHVSNEICRDGTLVR
jgi:hypothetical protein